VEITKRRTSWFEQREKKEVVAGPRGEFPFFTGVDLISLTKEPLS